MTVKAITCHCVLARSIQMRGCWVKGCLDLWWSHLPLVCFGYDLEHPSEEEKKNLLKGCFFPKKKTKQTCVWNDYLITHRWQAPLPPSTQNHFLLHEQWWQWFSSGCPVKQRGGEKKSVFFSHLHTIGQTEGKQMSFIFQFKMKDSTWGWPDVRGTCRGRASRLGGPQRQGCSCRNRETFREINWIFAQVAAKTKEWEIYAPYSPLASSSQISKKTMRSYFAWQGPAVERFIVLSFVAGTEGQDIHVWDSKKEGGGGGGGGEGQMGQGRESPRHKCKYISQC